MNFSYRMPTELFAGRDCVAAHGARLKELGTRALIVTGKSSGKNGALKDVLSALRQNGQEAFVFDGVLPNPTLACVREGITLLKRCGADFVIGLGGGSPMDAAKAIALLCVEERGDEAVFSGGYGRKALPMAHIPTTAGTGSEVTPYSILTNDAAQTKTSISSPALYPRFAFLDGKYMEKMPVEATVNPAIDAFSHAAESLLSRRRTPLSALYAREALAMLYPLLPKTRGALSLEERDMLLLASALAGMAISQSGTTAVHGMGYCLTYFYKIDHGRANGLLLGEALRLSERKKVPAAEEIANACNASIGEICRMLDRLLGEKEHIPKERLLEFARRSAGNKNIPFSAYEPTEEELKTIFLRSFEGERA